MPEQTANIPPSEAATQFREAERQRAVWETLTTFIARRYGWVVSKPVGTRMMFECQIANDKLPASLAKIGYKPVFMGVRERTGSAGLFKVKQYEIALPK